MAEILSWVRDNELLFAWLGGGSLVLLVATVIALPVVVAFLPQDYFVRDQREPAREQRRHPAVWWFLAFIKNVVGGALIVAGLVMLLLPGQGVLTILIGITLTNFPGKFTLERRLVGVPAVARALNRIRQIAGRPRLDLPDTS